MHVEIKPRNRIQQVNSSCTCGQRREIDLALRKDPHLAFINGKKSPLAILSAQDVCESKSSKRPRLLALGFKRWGPF